MNSTNNNVKFNDLHGELCAIKNNNRSNNTSNKKITNDKVKKIGKDSKIGNVISVKKGTSITKLKCKISKKNPFSTGKKLLTSLNNNKQKKCYNKPCWHKLSYLDKKINSFKKRRSSKKKRNEIIK